MHCDVYDETFPGGIGRPVTPVTTPDYCTRHNCQELAGNGQCDVSSVLSAVGVCVCCVCVDVCG